MEARTAYSIQYWLESCPQGYLKGTEYGHERGAKEPDFLLENPVLRDEAIGTTVQLVVGERAALAASSGLINAAPDAASKDFLATQTLDEARHVEIFTQRLFDLGVKRDELESTITRLANPHLVRFAEILLEKVDKKDFVAGVVGQNIVLEGLAFSTFEMMQTANRDTNPKFAPNAVGHDRGRAATRRIRGEQDRVADSRAAREEARDRADAEGHGLPHARHVRGSLPWSGLRDAGGTPRGAGAGEPSGRRAEEPCLARDGSLECRCE